MKTNPSTDQRTASPGVQIAPPAASSTARISIAVSGKIEIGISWGATASISIEMIPIAGISIGRIWIVAI
jgi:hypothetical protein